MKYTEVARLDISVTILFSWIDYVSKSTTFHGSFIQCSLKFMCSQRCPYIMQVSDA